MRSIDLLRQFNDDPQIYIYTAYSKTSKKFSDGYKSILDGSGSSLTSKQSALFTCLTELMERFSQACYRESAMVKSSFINLDAQALDPMMYRKTPSIRKNKLSWVEGYNFTKNSKSFIPAQLLYVNYKLLPGEIGLDATNSTGAAGGLDPTSTLLRAIYEVVERDAFMTMYLIKHSPKRIAIEKIRNKNIQMFIRSANRYNLELALFDITNDLKIPSFMAMLLDKTGLGPMFTMGLKSSLSMETAILGSVKESFQGRAWVRKELLTLKGREVPINPAAIRTLRERLQYWLPKTRFKKLDFLFQKSPVAIDIPPYHFNQEDELAMVKKIFMTKGMEVFYADLTLQDFKNLGFFVYKAIIPSLQMLILNEPMKTIRYDRLNAVAAYCKHKQYSVNTIPQPLL